MQGPVRRAEEGWAAPPLAFLLGGNALDGLSEDHSVRRHCRFSGRPAILLLFSKKLQKKGINCNVNTRIEGLKS